MKKDQTLRQRDPLVMGCLAGGTDESGCRQVSPEEHMSDARGLDTEPKRQSPCSGDRVIPRPVLHYPHNHGVACLVARR